MGDMKRTATLALTLALLASALLLGAASAGKDGASTFKSGSASSSSVSRSVDLDTGDVFAALALGYGGRGYVGDRAPILPGSYSYAYVGGGFSDLPPPRPCVTAGPDGAWVPSDPDRGCYALAGDTWYWYSSYTGWLVYHPAEGWIRY